MFQQMYLNEIAKERLNKIKFNVNEHVSSPCAFLCELSTTQRARVRLLSRVDARVDGQVVGSCEHFTTHVTHVSVVLITRLIWCFMSYNSTNKLWRLEQLNKIKSCKFKDS